MMVFDSKRYTILDVPESKIKLFEIDQDNII